MAEPILDAARVVAGIGQSIATRVAEHMRVGLDAQASRRDCPRGLTLKPTGHQPQASDE
jgi:hypothetical protein